MFSAFDANIFSNMRGVATEWRRNGESENTMYTYKATKATAAPEKK